MELEGKGWQAKGRRHRISIKRDAAVRGRGGWVRETETIFSGALAKRSNPRVRNAQPGRR